MSTTTTNAPTNGYVNAPFFVNVHYRHGGHDYHRQLRGATPTLATVKDSSMDGRDCALIVDEVKAASLGHGFLDFVACGVVSCEVASQLARQGEVKQAYLEMAARIKKVVKYVREGGFRVNAATRELTVDWVVAFNDDEYKSWAEETGRVYESEQS